MNQASRQAHKQHRDWGTHTCKRTGTDGGGRRGEEPQHTWLRPSTTDWESTTHSLKRATQQHRARRRTAGATIAMLLACWCEQ